MQKTPEQWLDETAPTKKGLAALKGWRKVIYWSALHEFFRAATIYVHIVTQEPK